MNNNELMKNVTEQNLTDLQKIPIGEISHYSTKKLYCLIQAATKAFELARKNKEWLEGAIALKFQQDLEQRRKHIGKETGIVKIADGNYQISSDIPKRIEWDQKLLSKLAEELRDIGNDPKQYMEIIYNISETKYKSLNEIERNIFLPARTLKLGKVKYQLSLIKDHKSNLGGK